MCVRVRVCVLMGEVGRAQDVGHYWWVWAVIKAQHKCERLLLACESPRSVGAYRLVGCLGPDILRVDS